MRWWSGRSGRGGAAAGSGTAARASAMRASRRGKVASFSGRKGGRAGQIEVDYPDGASRASGLWGRPRSPWTEGGRRLRYTRGIGSITKQLGDGRRGAANRGCSDEPDEQMGGPVRGHGRVHGD